MDILSGINSPEDVKQLDKKVLPDLCRELREFLIENISETGGHLSSNLGVVELTVAIHRIFDTSRDRLVFDVGHQSYVHKILTGRREAFPTLRKYEGIAGFPKPSESVHDAFVAGHASNSISAALGMARARTICGKDYSVIALIGDGALTGGLAYEALSDAGDSGEPLIVILNDNGMSIKPNVGGIARHLAHQRLKPSYLSFKKTYRAILGKVPGGKAIYRFTHNIKSVIKQAVLQCSMFEEMGFRYLGPVDGHDIERLSDVLRWARDSKQPILIHAITKKGKGYSFSEENPDKYHGVSSFDTNKGVTCLAHSDFSGAFGAHLSKMAESDKRVIAVTASMADGTGLSQFAAQYPDRFFDVGIAEGHAVSMAAGAASAGLVPVCAIYSTFLQRSYDMLIHDIAILGLHVVLAVDRAGLVGEDGETHHGVFDVSFLCSVPGMTVLCPSSFAEMRDMLKMALYKINGPVAIRYPRGSEGDYKAGGVLPSKILREGSDITIVTYGVQINEAVAAAAELERLGVSAEIVKLDFISPLDMKSIISSVTKTSRIIIFEEAAGNGCAGERILARLAESGAAPKSAVLMNLGNSFVTHGNTEKLRACCGLDAAGIVRAALKELRRD